MSKTSDGLKVLADIVAWADGSVVGRTRLQKIGFLLHKFGYLDVFPFKYKHYGPYSEEMAATSEIAVLLGFLTEEQRPTKWGGTYSIFKSNAQNADVDDNRAAFVKLLNDADAVVLELAATAILLDEEYADPWSETSVRKPEKATLDRVEKAKSLVSQIKEFETPVKL